MSRPSEFTHLWLLSSALPRQRKWVATNALNEPAFEQHADYPDEERVLAGSLYGSAAPKTDIPAMIDLYRAERLKLDELLTHTYPIEEINAAYEALQSGETLRSVVTF